GELCARQRSARPIGEAVGLVQVVAGDALDELVVGDRVAEAEHHRGNLTVENRVRNPTGHVPDDFDVLTRGMENLQDALVDHQLEEWSEIYSRREGVDHDRLVGAGDLRNTK